MIKKIVSLFLTAALICSMFAFPMLTSAATSLGLTNDPHSGKGMLKLNANGSANFASSVFNIRNMTVGKTYTISLWVKGDSGIQSVMRIVNNSDWSQKILDKTISGSTEWTKLEFTTSAALITTMALAFMNSSSKVGMIYVDDITVKRTDGTTDNVSIDNPGFEAAGGGSYGEVLLFLTEFSQNGTQIHKLAPGKVDVSIDFSNRAGLYPDGLLMAALYHNNTLTSVGLDNAVGLSKNEIETLSASVNVDSVDENTILKVFLWETKEAINPLSINQTIMYSTGTVHGLSIIDRGPFISSTYRRGVNINGPEFGPVWRDMDNNPATGVDGKEALMYRENHEYTFNDEDAFKYFAGKGFDIFRIPIRWQGVQPTLGGALNPTFVDGIKRDVAWAKKYGGQIIIDLHNYGGYDKKIGEAGGPTIAQFTDLWVKLSNEFKNETGVYAYDTMNEPSGSLLISTWKAASQACVSAVRANGDNKLMLIEGMSFSNASGWVSKNAVTNGGWITDPADNYMYSAHHYFDGDLSGQYKKSFDAEGGTQTIKTRVVNGIHDFIDWCQMYGERGLIGEFGVPGNDTRWNEILDACLDELDAAGMDATYWQGSTWSTNDPVSLLPINYKTTIPTDRPQLATLLQHLTKK